MPLPYDIARLKELEAKATPGPWEIIKGFTNGPDAFLKAPDDRHIQAGWEGEMKQEDAEFISSFRNAFPAMCADLEQLTDELESFSILADEYFAELKHLQERETKWQAFGAIVKTMGDTQLTCLCAEGSKAHQETDDFWQSKLKAALKLLP